jgi:uncharacterized membrane protein YbhN (UPF0104 family)
LGRVLGTLTVTGLCTAYVLWKIDIGRTATLLGDASVGYFAAAVAISVLAVVPMAWRWQQLLRARGVAEHMPWLLRTYFVSNAVAQVLPTSLGGDAARIFSTARRHRGHGTAVTGSVLVERVLWIEAAIGAGTAVAAVLLFSTRARRTLRPLVPLLRRARIERPFRAAYEGIHGYRAHARLLAAAFVLTIAVTAFRVLAIWLIGKSVGVELSPRPYYVMGPMLFLVMIVPFTINGVALREAFFVSFLGKLHVNPDAAFATGFLFFLLSVVVAVPGAAILAAEALVPSKRKEKPADVRT